MPGDGTGYGPAVLRLARNEPSAILLAAQLAGVLLYPFTEAATWGGRSTARSVVSRLVGLTVMRRQDAD
jgi:hypothetical protein